MSTPIITVDTVSTSKVSLIAGENACNASFMVDQELIYWEARAGGAGFGQGVLVANGQNVQQTISDLEAANYTTAALEALNYRADNIGNKLIVNPNVDVNFSITADELTLGDGAYTINVYGTNPAGESGG